MKNFHIRCFCVLCIVAILLSGCNNTPVPSTSVAPLTIIPSQAILPIPSSLIGMNIELIDLCSMLQMDAIYGKAYEHLFTNFGKGTLHIAGHSADESLWEPNATQSSCLSTSPVLTKTIVDKLFTFAQRIHWRVIWELGLLAASPQMDASEARYITSVGGSTLLGFSIGNEPELYAKHGYRPAGWGFKDYIAQWEQYRAAIVAADPSTNFIGPDLTVQSPWLQDFLAVAGTSKNLIEISRHYYFYSGVTHSVGLQPVSLLDPKTTQLFFKEATGWVSAADSYQLPIVLTEVNTISNGGIRGVSNSFAAALWTSNILFQSASLGIQQIDFQEVPHASYASINSQGVPQIVYYGELFFYLAATGNTMLSSVLNTTENVSSYVLKGTDGTLHVVVINKEPLRGIEIAVSPGSSYHRMTTLRLQAPSLAATTGATIGNATLSINGTFVVPPLAQESINGTRTVLNIPASSAALFTFYN